MSRKGGSDDITTALTHAPVDTVVRQQAWSHVFRSSNHYRTFLRMGSSVNERGCGNMLDQVLSDIL